MKRALIILLLIIIIFLLLSAGAVYWFYKNQNKTSLNTPVISTTMQKGEKDVRQAVFENLPTKQQERVTSWREASVKKVTLKGNIVSPNDNSYKEYVGKEVYMVDFLTDTMAIPNNMIVFADIKTHEIIGYGLVD